MAARRHQQKETVVLYLQFERMEDDKFQPQEKVTVKSEQPILT